MSFVAKGLCNWSIIGLRDAIGEAIVYVVGVDDICGFLACEWGGVFHHVGAIEF